MEHLQWPLLKMVEEFLRISNLTFKKFVQKCKKDLFRLFSVTAEEWNNIVNMDFYASSNIVLGLTWRKWFSNQKMYLWHEWSLGTFKILNSTEDCVQELKKLCHPVFSIWKSLQVLHKAHIKIVACIIYTYRFILIHTLFSSVN